MIHNRNDNSLFPINLYLKGGFMSEKKWKNGEGDSLSFDRRQFMKLSATYGFTAATVALAGGTLSSEAVAQTAKEEEKLKASAKYTMNVATAYRLGASQIYPLMQQDFKRNIQNLTRNEVYVKLYPAGQLGVGPDIASKVQQGTVQVGQHSVSNFAPFAPAADLINIPYWCGENQKFVNLVTSKTWRDMVNPKVEQNGYTVLWYVCIDPRVVAIRKGLEGPIKTPDQMKGIKFRVPGSALLKKFYSLLGANPTPVAWGETSSAIKEGVADALDPSVEALDIYGFKNVLSWVTFNNAIPDSQVYSCNLKWFRSLPSQIQDEISQACEITFRQNLAQVPAARGQAMNDLSQAGVQFYKLTEDEFRQWKEKAGAQLDVWNEEKKQLAGSLKNFDKLLEAANTYNKSYYVQGV